MNELIEHLAEKATKEMDQEAFSEDMNIPPEWYHKFAKLIVNECMYIGRLAQINNQLVDIEIKDHFGIDHFGVEE
jgi:hypothetical protein